MHILNNKAALLACLLTAALGGTAAEAASFDCNRAATPTEVAICADAGLSQLDEQMAAAYRTALAAASEADALKESQREWLALTATCGDNRNCLATTYGERLAQLQALQQPADSEQTVAVDTSPAEDLSAAALAKEPPVAPEGGGSPEGADPSDAMPNESGAPPLVQLAFGGLLIGLLAVVAVCLLGTKWVADRSSQKYGWRMILNWWNGLYVVGVIATIYCIVIGAPFGGAAVFGAIWLVMLLINVRKTSLGFGFLMTLMQPFVVFIIFMGIQLTRMMFQSPKYQRTG